MNTKDVVQYLETNLNSSTKLMLGAFGTIGLIWGFYGTTNKTEEITSPTVMITNMKGNSGGSGVVISTNEQESEILTNSHVCNLLPSGGKVTTTYGSSHVIKYYKQDRDHDLCLVVIGSKLQGKAKVAKTKPKLYENATISGHPSLLPNVVSKGHFSGNKVISVFLGTKSCTRDDMMDEDTATICFFFGGMPVIRTYEAEVVTALISAGSSGSAVYNEKQELSGLAFAGKGDLSYAFVVPFEYVSNFLNNNANGKARDTFKYPDYNMNVLELLSDRNVSNKKDLVHKCISEKSQNEQIKNSCDIIIDTVKWENI